MLFLRTFITINIDNITYEKSSEILIKLKIFATETFRKRRKNFQRAFSDLYSKILGKSLKCILILVRIRTTHYINCAFTEVRTRLPVANISVIYKIHFE